MAIRTSEYTSTGSRTQVPFDGRSLSRVAIKTTADVTFFGNATDTDGFPWTATDLEFAPTMRVSDELWVIGVATLSIMEWSAK